MLEAKLFWKKLKYPVDMAFMPVSGTRMAITFNYIPEHNYLLPSKNNK